MNYIDCWFQYVNFGCREMKKKGLCIVVTVFAVNFAGIDCINIVVPVVVAVCLRICYLHYVIFVIDTHFYHHYYTYFVHFAHFDINCHIQVFPFNEISQQSDDIYLYPYITHNHF